MFTLIEDVSALSNDELLSYSVKLAQYESDIGLRIIACLREAEKRLLYCEVGVSSLWEFATQYLGLSNGNAQVKIDAMRLARDNPVAQEKIESGELSILNAAKVNSFLRQERKSGKLYTPEAKKEVIESVLGLSQSKCERALLARSPEAIPAEKIRPLTDTLTELSMVVDEETLTLLKRLKELLSHKMPEATHAQLLGYLVREKVETLERKQMGATLAELDNEIPDLTPTIGAESPKENAPPSPSIPTPRKYIGMADQRWVKKRARGQCESIKQDGRRCTSRWKLEIDHRVPIVSGGTNHRSNLRVCCRSCNLYYAQLHISETIMQKYVPSLR